MKTSIALALGLLLTTTSGAMAATGAPTTLIVGSAAGTTGSGTNTQCLVYSGLSTFQRETATSSVHPKAVIGLTGVGYQTGSAAAVYRYGQAVLTFNSATTGAASFDTLSTNTKLPANDIVNFVNYSQTWVAAQHALQVRFKLQLPSCDLQVNLLFRAAAPS